MLAGSCVAAYAAASFCLYRFPTLLHRYKQPIQLASLRSKWLICHRGGCQEYPENTLQAFKSCVEQKYDMLELDVYLTKDKQVVVVHDQRLLRLCGEDVDVTQTNFGDLPPLSEKFDLHFSPKLEFDCSVQDRKLPLLKEVFAACPSTPINIELKHPSTELRDAVEGLITEFRRENITVWGAKSNTFSKSMHERNPSIPQFFSVSRTLLVYLLFVTGLLPFVPLREQYLEVPFVSKSYVRWKQEGRGQMELKWRLFIGAINGMHKLTPYLIPHLNKRGIMVFAWVLNDIEDFQEAMQVGFNGIMTDAPSLLNKFYQANGISTKQ
eukprot:GILI01018062.1.p1 GENE.GILI01018062.1~~GILI01018062.1.p1  ORF type:complete len:324 (+),score=66.13 GILI01018062.1:165-1136(+)